MTTVTRPVPYEPGFEETVIGAALNGRWYLDRIRATGIVAEDFYVPQHAHVFATIVAAASEAAGEDRLRPFVKAKLIVDGVWERFGGDAQFAEHSEGGYAGAASATPVPYAQAIIRESRRRALMGYGEQIIDLARRDDPDHAIPDVLADATRAALMPTAGYREPTSVVAFVDDPAVADLEFDWVIPEVLARQEMALFVAEPGAGKSTLFRQIALAVGAGLNPFTRLRIPRRRVLLLDFQDTTVIARRALRAALAPFDDDPIGRAEVAEWVTIYNDPAGIDLTSPDGQATMTHQVAAARADLVIAGPLYNMVAGKERRSKHSEETAEMAGRFLIRLMADQDCAMLLEAHGTHASEGALRVRGSKWWEDAASFGFGLKDVSERGGRRELNVVRFRGDRDIHRSWPSAYHEGHGRWAWDATIPEPREGRRNQIGDSIWDDDVYGPGAV